MFGCSDQTSEGHVQVPSGVYRVVFLMHPSVHARVVFVSGAALVQPCVPIVSLFDAPLVLALPAKCISDEKHHMCTQDF